MPFRLIFRFPISFVLGYNSVVKVPQGLVGWVVEFLDQMGGFWGMVLGCGCL